MKRTDPHEGVEVSVKLSERVWVELDETTPRIKGTVHGAKGLDIAFDGWIELMSALSAVGATP